jgi:hypothetical protein
MVYLQKIELNSENMKIGCIITAVIGVILLAVGYISFYWEFADGIKTGQVNFVTRKGYIWKTYEGRLIQQGIKSKGQQGLGSNEFDFSVEDDSLARTLELVGESIVTVRYKEYNHALWWRGNSNYVVYKIEKIIEPSSTNDPISPLNNIVDPSANAGDAAADEKWYE